jgi:hypothetical protein
MEAAGISERQWCRFTGFSRSTQRLRRKGMTVNRKRVPRSMPITVNIRWSDDKAHDRSVVRRVRWTCPSTDRAIGCAVFGVFDGLIRVDFSRGLYPLKQWRTDFYLSAAL